MPLAPFVRIGTGFHPSVDLDALLSFYKDLPLDVWNITSPSDLVGWEVLRERHGIADSDAVPCDLFVWGTGTPPDGRLTRVGGSPWLPKDVPWPDIDGVVPSFLCQFDFRDSLDLVGDLPGDLLLVFVAEEDAMLSADADRMRFLWVSAAETEVIEAAAVPSPTHPFEHVCAWGVRHRSVDVPSCWDRAHAIKKDKDGRGRLWSLPVLWGTKIGGVPYDSQNNLHAVPPGYLCQLVSIQPSCGIPWPWADREAPLTDRFKDDGMYAPGNNLMIGDMGELTFYVRSDGSISVDSACG
jgi:hypothetical protein